MNETLFLIGDLPVTTGIALVAFGALALVLLLSMVVVIARSGRNGAAMAMAQAIRADELEERLSEVLRGQSEATGASMPWARPWPGDRPRWPAPSANGWIR